MNNEKLIIEIYNQTINDVLIGVEEKYKKELCLGYEEYLKNLYMDFDCGDQKLEDLVMLFSDLEKSKWRDAPINMKLSELLKDPAFDNIKYISNIGHEYANSMVRKHFEIDDETILEPVIDPKKAQECIEMLNAYYKQVRDFNKTIAEYYISEGSIDFQFASGITKCTSLRVGRIRK